jgi:hypothetical protein
MYPGDDTDDNAGVPALDPEVVDAYDCLGVTDMSQGDVYELAIEGVWGIMDIDVKPGSLA